MGFTTASAGEIIESALWNELVGAFNGSVGKGKEIYCTDYSHATTPSFSLRNQHASGTPLRIYKTVAGIDTDLLKVTNADSMVTVENLTITGGMTVSGGTLTAAKTRRYRINPKDYGVLGGYQNSDNDNTAINNILDIYRAGYFPIVPGEGLALDFPPDGYQIKSINGSNIDNVEIGGTPGGTVFWVDRQTVAGPGFDLTGANDWYIHGIVVAGDKYGSSDTPNIVPTCGFLVAPSASGGSGSSNAHKWDFVSGTGHFSSTFWYGFGTVDQSLDWVHPNMDESPGKPGFIITRSNIDGLTSPFTTIYASPQDTQNIHFYNIGSSGMILEDVFNIGIFGGNIDGNTAGYCLKIKGGSTGVGQIKLSAVQLTGSSAALIAGGGAIQIDANTPGAALNVMGLSLDGPNCQDILSTSIALIKAGAGVVLDECEVRLLGTQRVPVGAKILDHATPSPASTVVVKGGEYNCSGGDFATGGGQLGVRVNNAGTMTVGSGADATGCVWTNPTSPPTGTAAIILGWNNAVRTGDGSLSHTARGYSIDTNTGNRRAGADLDAWVAGGVDQAQAGTAGLLARRLLGTGLASSLAVGNFGTFTNWGTSPSCSAVSGTEVAGTFTITAGSGSPGASPTVTFTYPGGAYASAPTLFIQLIGGTGSGVAVNSYKITPGTSSATIQVFFAVAPSAGATLQFSVFKIG